MLAAAMKAHVATVAEAITPKGGRPPFTRRMSAREAYDWWLKHRYDPIGLAEYGKMAPLQQQQLDAWLGQANGAQQGLSAPQPEVARAKIQQPNVAPYVLRPAQAIERRMEGEPPGPEVS
jgi:hypothetical protein